MAATFLNEDAYFRVLKAFAAGSYDLKKEMLLAKLRRELAISDQRHELLRAMIEEGRELKQRDYTADFSKGLPQAQLTRSAHNGKNFHRSLGHGGPGLGSTSPEDEEFVRAGQGAVPPSSPFNPSLGERQSLLPSNGYEASRPAKRLRKDVDGGATRQGSGDINELIGFKIRRWWPENGGWFEGAITDYRPATGEHWYAYDQQTLRNIVYDMNTPSESYEWFDLSISREDEFQLRSERINIIEHAPRGQALQVSTTARPPRNSNTGVSLGGQRSARTNSGRGQDKANGPKAVLPAAFVVEREATSSSDDSLSD